MKEWLVGMKYKKDNENARDRNENERMKIWTDNKIGDSGARMISELLKANCTLTTLDLSGDEQ